MIDRRKLIEYVENSMLNDKNSPYVALEKARDEATQAKQEAAKSASEAKQSKEEATQAKEEAAKSATEATQAKQEAAKSVTEATQAKDEATKSASEAKQAEKKAEEAKTASEKARDEATQAKQEAAKSAREAEVSKNEAKTASETAKKAENTTNQAKSESTEAKRQAEEAKQGIEKVKEELAKDGFVTENKIADNAVTESKIKDGSVTESKLGDDVKQILDSKATKDDINKMNGEVRHIGALSAALSGLHPLQYSEKNKNQLMAAVGTYRDKQAVAVGVAHYFSENFMLSAGVSIGEDVRQKSMANVGLSWRIGGEEESSSSSIKTTELQAENQELKVRLEKLEKQMESMMQITSNLGL